ncbi:MAG: ABC-F family ATP-binding cassette domain-containing protein, partial [Myxococcales bacterium]|nr:ABC-F family ATP-binding cassette domain-containing protein [Myxococcales bacterium]
MTAILTVQGLEKRFGTRAVLNGASFAVHERDRIGMIGANGAGKSTLLEMVVYQAMHGSRAVGGTSYDQEDPILVPDAGLVTWKRDLALEYVAQEPVLDAAATVGDSVARDGVADYEIATIAAALELPPLTQRIATLSLGERRR